MAEYQLGFPCLAQIACGLFGRLASRFSRLNLCRAELEFRNLAEWIERRVGQDVCCRFHKGKRNEYSAVRDAIVLTRIEFDFAAARGDTHHVARLDSELGKGAARERSNRRRFQCIKDGGTARHRAGVPMLELTPRGQDEWILVIWCLDRKSTRLNSSHLGISYAVFC